MKALIFFMELMYKGPLIAILLICLCEYIKMLKGTKHEDNETEEKDG